jgi:hypothetical protein
MPSPVLSPAEKKALVKKYPTAAAGHVHTQMGDDRLALKALLIFSTKRAAHENPLFLFAVKGARAVIANDEKYNGLVTHIYHQFVADDSPMTINVISATREAMKAKVERTQETKVVGIRQGGQRHFTQTDGITDLHFVPALAEIKSLLRKDTWIPCLKWMNETSKNPSTIQATAMNGIVAQQCNAEITLLESFGIHFG